MVTIEPGGISPGPPEPRPGTGGVGELRGIEDVDIGPIPAIEEAFESQRFQQGVQTDEDILDTQLLLQMAFPQSEAQPYLPALERRIHQIAESSPDVYDAIREDAKLALTFDDATIREAYNSTGVTADLRNLVESAWLELRIEGAEYWWMKSRFEDQENWRGWYDEKTTSREQVLEAATGQIPEGVTAQREGSAATFSAWSSRIATESGQWTVTDGRLVASIGDAQFSVKLADGVVPTTDADAKAALALGLAGLAHEVEVADLGTLLDDRTILGNKNPEFGVDIAGVASELLPPGMRMALDNLHSQAVLSGFLDTPDVDVDAIKQFVREGVTGNQMIALAAANIRVNAGEANMTPGVALDLAQDIAAEDPDAMREFEEMIVSRTADEIVEEQERILRGDPRTGIEQFFDAALDRAMVAVDWVDDVAHYVGQHAAKLAAPILAELDNLAEAVVPEMSGAPGTITNWLTQGVMSIESVEEAVDAAINRDWDEIEFGGRMSEFIGVEGAAAEWVDLATAIVFDPTNLLFPGGKVRSAVLMEMTTNPQWQGQLMRIPAMRSLTDNIMSAGASLADDAGSRLTRITLSLDNFSAEGTVRLWDALRSGAGRDAVEDIIAHEVYYGAWAPASFGHANARGTALGIGDMVSNWGIMDADQHAQFARMMAVTSSEATVRVSDDLLSFDDYKRFVMQVFVDEPEMAEDAVRRWLDATANAERARDALDEVRTLATQQMNELRTKLGDETFTQARNQLGQRQQELQDVRNTLFGADEATTATGGPPAIVDDVTLPESQRAFLQDLEAQLQGEVDRLSPIVDEYNAIRGQLTKASKEAKAAQFAADGIDPTDARRLLWNQMLDEVAERLNLATNADGTWKWSDIRFGSHDRMLIRESLAPEIAPGGTMSAIDDIDGAANMEAFGALQRQNFLDLPAAPSEIVTAFWINKLRPEEGTRIMEEMRSAFARFSRNQTVRRLRTMWAYSLLLNFTTPFKTRLDEAIGYYIRNGSATDTLQSLLQATPGAQKFADAPLVGAAVWNVEDADSYVRQFIRENVEGTLDDTQRAWTRIANPAFADELGDNAVLAQARTTGKQNEALFRQEAERFLNGSVSSDPMFQQYAAWKREVLSTEELHEWWRLAGTQLYDTSRQVIDETGPMSVRVAADVDPNEPWRLFEENFERWLEDVVPDPKVRDMLRERILDAATDPNGRITLANDSELLRQMRWVRGQYTARSANDAIFDTLFGTPQARSAGIMFQHDFDERLARRLTQAEKTNRLLTPERLIEVMGERGVVLTPDEATFMLRTARNQSHMRRLMGEGFVTEDMLRRQVAATSTRQTNDLMFNMQSSAIIGRSLDNPLAFPYLRAQTDFVGRMGRALTDGSLTRINPVNLQMMEDAGGVRGLLGKALQPVGQFGAAVDDLAARLPVRMPINMRLLSRWAHLIGSVTNHDPENGFFTPAGIMNAFTFLPLKMSGDFLVDIVPQPGVGVTMPLWMLEDNDWLPDEVKAVLEMAWPRIEWAFDDFQGANPFQNALNVVLPESKGSARSVSNAALNWLFPDAEVNLVARSEFPGTTSALRSALGDMHAENGYEVNAGLEEWELKTGETYEGALRKLLRGQSATEFWQGIMPLATGNAIPNLVVKDHLKHFPFAPDPADATKMELFDLFTENGVITRADQRELFADIDPATGEPGLWRQWQDGTISNDDFWRLEDAMVGIMRRSRDIEFMPPLQLETSEGEARPQPGITMFEWAVFNHPELAAMSVSMWGCKQDAPADWKATYCNEGRLDEFALPEDPDARSEMIADFRNQGFLGARTDVQAIETDIEQTRSRAASRVLTWAYQRITEQRGEPVKDAENRTFTIDANGLTRDIPQMLDTIGYEHGLETDTRLTVGEFYEIVKDAKSSLNVQYTTGQELTNNALTSKLRAAGYGEMMTSLSEYANQQELQEGIGPREWDEGVKLAVRDQASEWVDLGIISLEDYNRHWAWAFGELDYEPPEPPTLGAAESVINIPADAWLADKAVVTDGDTIDLQTDDGTIGARFIGINTPEEGEEGYLEAKRALKRFIADHADRIDLVMFDANRFGVSQEFAGGRHRLFVWLYVDGKPVYDPAAFTSNDPTGRQGVGGVVPDYESMIGGGG